MYNLKNFFTFCAVQLNFFTFLTRCWLLTKDFCPTEMFFSLYVVANFPSTHTVFLWHYNTPQYNTIRSRTILFVVVVVVLPYFSYEEGVKEEMGKKKYLGSLICVLIHTQTHRLLIWLLKSFFSLYVFLLGFVCVKCQILRILDNCGIKERYTHTHLGISLWN